MQQIKTHMTVRSSLAPHYFQRLQEIATSENRSIARQIARFIEQAIDSFDDETEANL
jgi:hypothetical protein